jgi:hypothetical protein
MNDYLIQYVIQICSKKYGFFRTFLVPVAVADVLLLIRGIWIWIRKKCPLAITVDAEI